MTDFGKRGSEADFTPPDLPLQIKICPSQRFYLGRSEKTVRVTSREHLPTDRPRRARGKQTSQNPFRSESQLLLASPACHNVAAAAEWRPEAASGR